VSLAGELEVETCESDAKRLEQRARVRYVHVKVLGADPTKLHVNVIVVVLVYELKILDGCLVNPSIEIENESLHLWESNNKSGHKKGVLTLVPLRWLIEEKHYAFGVIYFKLFLDCLVFLLTEKSHKVSHQIHVQCMHQCYLHQQISKLFTGHSRPPLEVILSSGVGP